MDLQLKRGMIEVCVLKALTKGDSYGYQLVKDISDIIKISESTLYPILKRLEAAKLLSVYSMEHNNRIRRYYKITPAGMERIDAFIDEWDQVMRVYHYIKGDRQDG